MPSIFKAGNNYTNPGFGTPASDILFQAGLSGMKSKNVNDAILELASIVTNAVSQFTSHTYEYVASSGKTVTEFLKESLIASSRAPGGFHLFYLTISEGRHYIGLTRTTGTKCSFDLHSVETPDKFYYGSFDNMNTGSPDSFSMYILTSTGENLFTGPDFEV